jgi:hypothetical protein
VQRVGLRQTAHKTRPPVELQGPALSATSHDEDDNDDTDDGTDDSLS